MRNRGREGRKIGIMVSGRGSNMEALIQAARAPDYPARVATVISSREKAPALARARQAGIEALYIPGRGSAWEQEALALIEDRELELICLAGFMRILSPEFVRGAPPFMNIHPSLLPAFPGLNAQQQALEYGVKISGCTVHFVDGGVDSGPIILQAGVPVKEGEGVEQLSRRILQAEHRIYPRAVELWARGALEIAGRRVHIREEK